MSYNEEFKHLIRRLWRHLPLKGKALARREGQFVLKLYEYIYCLGSVTRVSTKPPQPVTVLAQFNLSPLSVALCLNGSRPSAK